MDLLDRIADKFTVGDDCWDWTASLDKRGYGQVFADRKMRKAHQVIYELLVGPIPPGTELDHLCRNPRCVKPAHLEPVTHAENVRRGDSWRINGDKMECPSSHPYSPENTYVYPDGRRDCKTCRRAAVAACKARKKARNGS